MLDLIVQGGEIVTSRGTYRADVGIRDGRIAVIGATELMPAARSTLDASGKLVTPGFVDPHLHFRWRSTHIDTLQEALRAAAFGGVTTVLAMPLPAASTLMQPLELLAAARAEGEREAPIDFSFHLPLPERHGVLDEIPAAVAAGCPSFKIFMAYKSMGRMASDAHLLEAMAQIAAAGGTLLLHAEDGELIDRLVAGQVAAGRVRPTDFLATHPPEAEWVAVEKALAMGKLTGCPLVILHVSTPRAVDRIAESRAAGQRVWAETCPQYLELTDDLLATAGPFAKVSPPLRGREENEGLWQRLLDGRIDFIGSDHSPQPRELKEPGHDNIFACPYGAPGVETLVPVVADAARRRGAHLADVVRWCAEGPARAYGLYPRKGAIQVGSDADLVLWDATRRVTLRSETARTRAGYTLYDGREVVGWPVQSLLRGRLLLDGDTLRVEPGTGRFLERPAGEPRQA